MSNLRRLEDRRLSLRLLPVLSVILAVVCAANTMAGQPADSSRCVPNRLIIKLNSEVLSRSAKATTVNAEEIRTKFGWNRNTTITPLLEPAMVPAAVIGAAAGTAHPGVGVVLADFAEDVNLDSVITAIESLPWVEYAERDRLLNLFGAPNDPLYLYQWGLENTGQIIPVVQRNPGPDNDTLIWVNASAGFDVDFPAMHNHAGPRSRVVVGILDTGSDLVHPDLADNLWRNPGELPDNNLDDDHNGYVDDFHGYDFSGDEGQLPNELYPDQDPTDEIGHGTHVAGIVAAVTDNLAGISALASAAQIMTLKIFPNAYNSVATRAIYYSVDNGVDIINMSFGSPFGSRAMSEALAYARSRQILSVAAAGNDGAEIINYPAADTATLGVGATNYHGHVAGFSTIGDFVDLVAPGESILSLRAAGTDLYAEADEPGVHFIADDYILADGTSMAAPCVTGCAAALLSVESGLSAERLNEILVASCVDILDPYGSGGYFPGWDKYSGYGQVNLGRALNELAGVTLCIEAPHTGDMLSQTVMIEGTAGGPSFIGYELAYGQGPDPQSWTTLVFSSVPAEHAPLYTWDTEAAGLTGVYTLRLAAPTGHQDQVTLTLANAAGSVIDSPRPGDTLALVKYIYGSAIAPDFLSATISTYPENNQGDIDTVWSGTRPVADDLLCVWSIETLIEGWRYLKLTTETRSGTLADSVRVYIKNPYHEGWPTFFNAYAFFIPSVADLDGQPDMEYIVPTSGGLYVFGEDGSVAPGWPRDTSDNFETIAAVADLDPGPFPGPGPCDQCREIIIASRQHLHVYTFMGEPFDENWPREFTGVSGLYGLTIPLICDLNNDYSVTGTPEILAIDVSGTIRAFHDNGSVYSFLGAAGPLVVDVQYSNSGTLPRASVVDISSPHSAHRDGQNELIVAADGLWIWNAQTGAPFAGGGASAQIRDYRSSYGMAVGDFDGDDRELEIAVCYIPVGSHMWHLEILKADGTTLPGWPVNTGQSDLEFLITPLAAGDVDGDRRPELFITTYFIGDGRVMAYHADGSPLLPENPTGEFLALSGSASPVVLTDMTGDALPEIVFKVGDFFFGDELLYVLTPDGDFVPGYPLRIGFGIGSQLAAPLTTDIDGDGHLNLLTLEASGRVAAAWDFDYAYRKGGHPWPKFRRDNWNSGVLPSPPPMNPAYVVQVINYIFRGATWYFPPYHRLDGEYQLPDANCDGIASILDAVILVNYVFRSGPRPCIP
jgi:subtilisin family serine protease